MLTKLYLTSVLLEDLDSQIRERSYLGVRCIIDAYIMGGLENLTNEVIKILYIACLDLCPQPTARPLLMPHPNHLQRFPSYTNF